MSNIHSRCPVKCEKTIIMERMSSKGNLFFHDSEQEFLWLYETESTYCYAYKGKVIKEGSTFSDYYGFLSSVDSAIEEAQEIMKNLDIQADEPMEIIIKTSLSKRPVLLADNHESQMWNNHNSITKAYVPFIEDKDCIFYHDEDKKQAYLKMLNDPDQAKRFDAWSIVEPLKIETKFLVKKFVLGSSKTDFKQNLSELMKKFQEDLAI